MRIPRVAFVVPGLLVPALQAASKPLPAGAVGMIANDFARDVVTIHVGDRVTLFNNSNVVHIVGPGRSGTIVRSERGVPVSGFHLMQTNSVFTTPPWNTPGTYYLTCSVHPDMTLKVVVIHCR